jgi:fructose-1,6-bisphosphatase I
LTSRTNAPGRNRAAAASEPTQDPEAIVTTRNPPESHPHTSAHLGQTKTIERHILDQQSMFPEAQGRFTNIMYVIALTAKLVQREVSKAGLVDILGLTGSVNVQGEEVQKLDEFAHECFFNRFDHTGLLCGMASEEEEGIIEIPEAFALGPYVLLFDPLDGSSNIDANVSIGSIWALYRRKSQGGAAVMDDFLRQGYEQAAAGYVLYGSSTMMVYTTGDGVYGFTLDPSIGEFLLSHERMQIPQKGKIYSCNEGYRSLMSEGTRRYIGYLQEDDKETGRPYSSRYIGSMVADVHRTLLYGGIFMYPATKKSPNGKLRLMYEANPMAFIIEQAGGIATDGRQRILDIQATDLHQRTPLYLGSEEDMKVAMEFESGAR